MSSAIGDLLVRVSADVSGLLTGMQNASSAVTRAGQQLTNIGGTLTAGISAPLLGIGAAAVATASSFQSNMNMLQAVTQGTAAEMEEASQAAVQLGADVRLPGASASDAATAMLELGRAGLSVNESMSAARGVLQLAAAGELSVASAAGYTSAALNAFGLAGSEATAVANLLAAASNASAADVAQVGDAMQMSAAVFAAAKIPVNDLVTGIAQMANAGIQGSDAGTSLKTMLLSLQSPTAVAANLMSSLGISVYDAQGNMLPMRDIVGQFSMALSGLSQEQRNATLSTIFGSDAIRAANVVLMQGTTAWDEMSGAVNRAGAADDLAAARMAGLGGAFEGLKSSIETVLLTAALPFVAMLENLVRWVTDVIGNLQNLDPQFLNMAVTIGTVLAAAGPLTMVLGMVLTVIGALISPIGLVVLAVAGLAAAFASGAITIDTIRPVLDSIGTALTTLRGVVETVLTAIAAAWRTHASDIEQLATTAWKGVKKAVEDVVDALGPLIKQFVDGVVGWFEENWPTIQDTADTIFKGVQSVIDTVVTDVLPIISNFVTTVVGWFSENWPHIQAVIDLVMTTVSNIIHAVVAEVVPFITSRFQGVVNWVQENWPLIRQTIETVLGKVLLVVERAVGQIKDWWDQYGDQTLKIVEHVWDAIQKAIDTVITVIEGIIKAVMQAINGDWAGAWETIKTTVSTVWDNIKIIVGDVLAAIGILLSAWFESVKQTVIDKMESVKTWWQTKWNEIVAFLQNIDLNQIGRDIIQGLIDGVGAMGGALIAAATSLVNQAIEAMKRALGISSPSRVMADAIGKPLMQGVAAGAEEERQNTASEIAGVVLDIVNAVIDALRDFAGVKLPEETAKAIRAILEPIADALSILQEFEGIGAVNVDFVMALVREVILQTVQTLQEMATLISAAGLTAARTFAAGMGEILGVIKDALGVLSDAGEVDGLNVDFVMALVREVVLQAVETLRDIAAIVGSAGLAAAQTFAAGMGNILGVVGDALDVLDGMQELAGVDVDTLMTQVRQIIIRAVQALHDANQSVGQWVAEAAAFAAGFADAMTPIGEAVDVLDGMQELAGVDVDTLMTQVRQIIIRAVQALHDANQSVGQWVEEAATFAGQVRDMLVSVSDAMGVLKGIAAMDVPDALAVVSEADTQIRDIMKVIRQGLAGELALFDGKALLRGAFLLGASWLDRLVYGIQSKLPDLTAVLAYISGLFPHSPVKYGPLRKAPDWDSYLFGNFGQATGRFNGALESVSVPARGTGTQAPMTNNYITIHNPVRETAEASVRRELLYLAAGIF